ncbi:MAG: extracellular solute-binding protein [Bacteroidales bacterium]
MVFKPQRKITDLQKPCDLFLSADYRVIEDRLIPQFASWNLIFATNEMVVAYNPQSKYANEIKEDNWWEILARPDVEIGRSDPGMDPCGYHTVIVTKLADEQFAQKVLSRSEKNIRAKEVDLLTMLESHALDYLFIYKSVAQQHRLPYITLPKEINLGYPEYDYSYKTAYAVIAGKKPGTTDTIYGEPIYYSLTIPTHAQNPVLAQQFVDFITSEKGQYIITQKAKLTAIKPFFSEKSKNKK